MGQWKVKAMNRIKELRQKAGLTQAQLANEMGIVKQLISYYELEQRHPKPDMWNKLAEYFNVPTSYLMGLDRNDLKFPSKQEAIDFIHKIMKAQNIKVEDIQ